MKTSERLQSWDVETMQETKLLHPPRVLPQGLGRLAPRQDALFISGDWDMLKPLLKLVQELRRERDQLRRENEDLHTRLGLLNLRHQGSESPPAESNSSNPYSSWIRRHREELSKYQDCFLAIDVKADKVVEHSKDRSELNRRLIELFKRDESARARLLIIDTSLDF